MTKEEIAVLMPLIDAGLKATGIQVFANKGGATLQSALEKLQAMYDEQVKHG